MNNPNQMSENNCQNIEFTFVFPNNENIVMCFQKNNTILDMKKKILKDFPRENFEYIDFENISPKIFSEFGKLSFPKNLLPQTLDNYRLDNFCLKSDAKFRFNVIYVEKDINGVMKEGGEKKQANLSFLKTTVPAKKVEPVKSYDEDFPSLSSTYKK